MNVAEYSAKNGVPCHGNVIRVRYIETNAVEERKVERMWIEGFTLYAKLADSDLLAEMAVLTHDCQWKVFPN